MRLTRSPTGERPWWYLARATLLLTAVMASLGAACGGDDDDSAAIPDDEALAGLDTSQTLLEPGGSSAVVEVGGATYEFEVVCYEAGAGELIAVGSGTTPDGNPVDLLVEASVSQPYIGLHLQPDGPIIESALNQPLNLVVQDDHIRGGAIYFLRDVDLDTGVGTDAGVGDVDVTCTGYERGAPAGY